MRSANFAFISPNHAISGLDADEHAELGCFTEPQVDFVINGGFIYIDADGLLLDVNAVRSPSREEMTAALRGQSSHHLDHSFEIDGPYPLADVARKALTAAGRMQHVTSDFVRSMGANAYAWVLPEETFIESSVVDKIARRASRPTSVKRGAIGVLPATYGAFAYVRGHIGCYFRVIPSGVPHAHVTISSDMCTKRFAPFKLEPPLDCTIQELKAVIELRRGIPRRAQRLMRAGKVLRDETHLSECGISAGQAITLHVLIISSNLENRSSKDLNPLTLTRGMTSENVFATASAPAIAIVGRVANKLSKFTDEASARRTEADIAAVEIRGVKTENLAHTQAPAPAES